MAIEAASSVAALDAAYNNGAAVANSAALSQQRRKARLAYARGRVLGGAGDLVAHRGHVGGEGVLGVAAVGEQAGELDRRGAVGRLELEGFNFSNPKFLGEGGFGVVFLAEQSAPVKRRAVSRVTRTSVG